MTITLHNFRAGSRVRRMGAIAALGLTASVAPVSAQPLIAPRIWFSGWAGRFTNLGGFSDGGSNVFYRFDDATAFGAGVHIAASSGMVAGVDVLYAAPSYERFDRDTGAPQGDGDARAASALASVRLAGGGGILGLYLSAGAGVFAWDVDDPELDDGWDLDPALQVAAGLEYSVLPRTRLFAEYGRSWVYHQKDEAVSSNTANHTLLRLGVRVGL